MRKFSRIITPKYKDIVAIKEKNNTHPIPIQPIIKVMDKTVSPTAIRQNKPMKTDRRISRILQKFFITQ
jgi:hypothetical protein